MLVLNRGLESINVYNSWSVGPSVFREPKLWNSSKSLKKCFFFLFLDLLFLASWSAFLSFETWVCLRPILSLKDTACPIVRVPDFLMVYRLPGSWLVLSLRSFPQLNDTEWRIVRPLHFLVVPENLIFNFLGGLPNVNDNFRSHSVATFYILTSHA